MDLIRETPLTVGWRTWLARPPKPTLTVVVKATFDLKPGESALAEEQDFPCGARYVDDEVERGLEAPDELALFKRRGECFVLGACHPPDGLARRSQVAFQIGAVQKQIAVIGDRPSERGLGEPEEFGSIPLTWERARGGPGVAQNPAGRAIPNLEHPQRLMQSRGDEPPPVGTGPIAPTWRARAKLAGTYDASWQKTHYPGIAPDIDWEFFNEAPPDQRIEGFWRGDEELVLVNLLRSAPSLRTRLPAIRPRAFLTPAGSDDPFAHLWELPLSLDTIVVDGLGERVTALWRAVLDVGSDSLDEMHALCVLHDGPDDKRSAEDCAEVFRAAAAREAEEEAQAQAAAEASKKSSPLFSTLVGAELKWAHLDQAMTMEASRESQAELVSQLGALIAARGSSPGFELKGPLSDLLAGVAKDEGAPLALDGVHLREIEERVFAEESARESESSRETRRRVQRAVADGESCEGWDLTDVDLSKLRLTGADFRGARFLRASLAGAVLGDARFDGALFEEAELSDLQLQGGSFVGAEVAFCRLVRAHFGQTRLDDATFSECLLRESRFRQCVARRTELVRCLLDESTFDDSVFDAADFSESAMTASLFARTSLVDTRFIGVVARGARFERCDLQKVRLIDGAVLDGATLARCYGKDAGFADASAAGADFSFSELPRARFARAALQKARFLGCILRGARFDEAALGGASLVRADLFEARLEGADLRGADLRGASLFGAELLAATLEGAELELADLGSTRLAP